MDPLERSRRWAWSVLMVLFAISVTVVVATMGMKMNAGKSPQRAEAGFVDVAVDGPSVIVWSPARFETAPTYDWNKAITRGNRTFLPLVLPSMPVRQAELILDTLKAFEDAHPEWEIVAWRTDVHMYPVGTASRVEGLWVDHRPKATSGPENPEKK